MPITTRELADAALDSGLLERAQVEKLRDRRPLPEFVEMVSGTGRFPPSALYRAVAEARGIEFVDCDAARPALQLARRIPDVLLRRGLILPIESEGEFVLATADPDDRQTIASVRRILGGHPTVAMAEPEALRAAALRALAQLNRVTADEMVIRAEDATALLDTVLKEAWLRRASDVHLEPQEDGMRVRLRIDGKLTDYIHRLRVEEGLGLLRRVKVLAGLDIAEQRAPQDGGFTYTVPVADSEPIDLRAATLPTNHGERATLRLLGTHAGELTLDTLGMSASAFRQFETEIHRPHGILLLTGPTGSGKSTTLYAALRVLNRPEVNIVTVEDPIEYKIPGVSQVHVGGSDKVTFAGAIRSILRHDPDIIMVGEVRDPETADIALKAAMTGHLVLSTLHTNSAAGALTRLLDLGCEPYRVGASLIGVIAQRLVRRLCPRCLTWRAADEREAAALGVEEAEVPVPVGCARCQGRGFAGRIGIFEMLWIDEELARLLARGVPEGELRAAARDRVELLRTDGFEKVRAGVTTVDEVIWATVAEE